MGGRPPNHECLLENSDDPQTIDVTFSNDCCCPLGKTPHVRGPRPDGNSILRLFLDKERFDESLLITVPSPVNVPSG